MRYKRGLALVLALALVLGLLAGCAPEEEYEESSEIPVTLENTGEKAELVIAFSDPGDAYVEALEEIIEKYRADFPETEITLAPYKTEEERQAMLRSGEADLVEVEGSQQAGLVAEGLLWNFYPYLKVWRENPILNNIAHQATSSLGDKQAYVMPADFRQEVLFYRADWFEDYNDQQEDEEEKVYCKTWGQLCNVPKKLGDKARLALAGKDHLGSYFDAILWSRAGRGSMKEPCAAYFTEREKEVITLFDTDAGLDAAHRFALVMEEAAVPGCGDWGIDQAVDAFVNGEAGMLLADSSYYPALLEALPEDALGVEGFTRTDSGQSVARVDYWGWAIAEASDCKETAVHFLTYLSNADNNTHIAKVAGTLPINREALLMEPSFSEGDRGMEIRMSQLSNEFQYACRPDMYLSASEQFPALYEQLLRDFLAGDCTDEELLSELDAFWMEAYNSQPDTWSPKEEDEESEEQEGS